MGWILYAIAILIISGLIGMHLGRFREAYTEMTGMMAGMTMGMLNGFLLGFAAAAAATSAFRMSNTVSLFWGNVAGIVLGIAVGAYFGRAGGLMGIMDGGMGGVMGGSMGAMLAAMLVFPEVLLFWTALALSLVYVVGMVGLVVLIERSAPGHVALHRLAPMFTRAMATEAQEEAVTRAASSSTQIDDYYAFLGVPRTATEDAISEAYLVKLAVSDEAGVKRLERALAILTDPARRQAYDGRLGVATRGDCCPPPRVKKAVGVATTTVASSVATQRRAATAAVSERPKELSKGVAVTASNQAKQLPPRIAPATKLEHTPKSGATDGQRQARQQSQNVTHRPNKQPPPRRGGGVNGPLIGGGLAVILLLVAFGAWQLGHSMSGQAGVNAVAGTNASGNAVQTDSGSQLPPEFVTKLKSEAVAASIGSDGKQTLDLVVNGDTRGYKPNVIKVKQGVPVHFNLSVEGQDPG